MIGCIYTMPCGHLFISPISPQNYLFPKTSNPPSVLPPNVGRSVYYCWLYTMVVAYIYEVLQTMILYIALSSSVIK